MSGAIHTGTPSCLDSDLSFESTGGSLYGNPWVAQQIVEAVSCDSKHVDAGNIVVAAPAPTLGRQHVVTLPMYASAPAGMQALQPPAPPPGPAPGSLELPSVGSIDHAAGRCRPCAFLHTRGCATGPACTFCHLCEPGEKKKRSREKRQQILAQK